MPTWKKIVTESTPDNISQNALTATQLSSPVTINLTGEVTGTMTNDLTAGDSIDIATTVEDVLVVSNFVADAVTATGEPFADNDTSFPTTGAVIDYVSSQVNAAGSGTITAVEIVESNGIASSNDTNQTSGNYSTTLSVVADDGISVGANGVKADVDGTTITLTGTDGTGQISANTTAGIDSGLNNLVTGGQVYDYIENNTTSNNGTVTSVDIVTTDGLDHSGSAITTSGTFTLGIAEGGIANDRLANDKVTIGSTDVALGAAVTDIDGMTSLDGVNGGMTMNNVSSIQWAGGNVSLFTDLGNNNVSIGSNNVGYGVIIPGDLTVNGTTTTMNVTNVDIEDKMLKLAHTDDDGDQDISGANGGGIQLATDLDVNQNYWPEFRWGSGQGGGNSNGQAAGGGLTGWTVSNAQTQANTDHPISIMDFGSAVPGGATYSAGKGSFFYRTVAGSDNDELYVRID